MEVWGTTLALPQQRRRAGGLVQGEGGAGCAGALQDGQHSPVAGRESTALQHVLIRLEEVRKGAMRGIRRLQTDPLPAAHTHTHTHVHTHTYFSWVVTSKSKHFSISKAMSLLVWLQQLKQPYLAPSTTNKPTWAHVSFHLVSSRLIWSLYDSEQSLLILLHHICSNGRLNISWLMTNTRKCTSAYHSQAYRIRVRIGVGEVVDKPVV